MVKPHRRSTSALPYKTKQASIKRVSSEVKRGWRNDKMVGNATQCSRDLDSNTTDDKFMLNSTTYFYQGCVWKRSDAVSLMIECLHRIELLDTSANVTVPQCAQFCGSFRDALPAIYGAFSCLSLLCCLGVFITYFVFPRLQQSGYSSKVFLYRYSSTSCE